MGDSKGNLLYVNLSASQTRKRLKGFGHGVRQIQAADRNQAVIVHTATGAHLRDLQAKFNDVGWSLDLDSLSSPIENLPNLGPTSAQWLREIEIFSVADLRRLGPVWAYRQLKSKRDNVSLNLLWAMVAGLENRDWRSLTELEKRVWQSQIED